MAITSSGGVVSSGTTSNYNGGDSIADFLIYGTVTLNSATATSGLITSGGVEYAGQAGIGIARGRSIDDTVQSGGVIHAENYGIASGTVVKNGGTVQIDNGGSGSNITVSSGGVVSVFVNYGTGGTITATTVMSGGAEVLASGATGYNDSAARGGAILVSSGASEYASSGTAANVSALSGGTISVFSSGVVSGAVISSGGTFYNGLYGRHIPAGQIVGTDVGTIVSAGGSALWYNGALSISAQVLSGASVDVGYGQDGALTSTNMLIFSAGTIYAGGYAQIEKATIASSVILAGGSMSLVGSGGRAYSTVIRSGGVETLVTNTVETGALIYSGGKAVINASTSLVSAALYDRGSIDFNYLGGTITSARVTSSGLLTAYSNNGRSTRLQLAGVYPAGENTFQLNADTVTLVCFLEGTEIRTPSGASTVDALRIGDEVLAYDWRTGCEVAEHLTWVGSQRSVVRPHLPDDEAGYPVRILQDAIARGVPVRDLLVTPEHCLFFDGGFIPARMLVNGRSIYYDRSLTHFKVFHIETEHHAVLWSEGALSESYLDTGNRRQFVQPGNVATMTGGRKSWEHDAAAPLMVERAIVEPIHARLAARADAAGLAPSTGAPATSEDSDLHLVTGQGQVIRPLRQANGRVMFMVPANVGAVRLVSRTARPSDMIGPFVDDRRALGVLVGAVTMFASRVTTPLTAHLHDAGLPGWHGVEASACRWTAGDALMPVPPSTDGGILAVQVLAAGPYPLVGETGRAETRLAG